MTPPIFPLTDQNAEAVAQRALSVLRERPDALLLVPTETVYGLCCDWESAAGRDRIYRAKRREENKPLQMLAASPEMVEAAGGRLSPAAKTIAEKFCPGALTIVIDARDNAAIGFRVPDHPFMKTLIALYGRPLAATSANLSGQPPALSVAEALNVLEESPDLTIDAGPLSPDAKASTVIDARGDKLRLLREGPIPFETLQRAAEDGDRDSRDDRDGRDIFMTGRFIPAHGGYKKLLSYQKAEIVYDATIYFCDRFIDKRDRTYDQMIQAARSGKQNIIEGSMASGTSKEMEIKLTNVARSSLEELLADYRDFSRVRGFSEWDKEHPYARRLRDLTRVRGASYETFRKGIENPDPAICANVIIGLIRVTSVLLDRQIQQLERAFVERGGIREQMTRARNEERERRRQN